MERKRMIIKTPRGVTLGERILDGGKIRLQYKAGKKLDILSPEEAVECITGEKVAKIIYCKELKSH